MMLIWKNRAAKSTFRFPPEKKSRANEIYFSKNSISWDWRRGLFQVDRGYAPGSGQHAEQSDADSDAPRTPQTVREHEKSHLIS